MSAVNVDFHPLAKEGFAWTRMKLYHATTGDTARAIQRTGFQSSIQGMLGPGIYFAKTPYEAKYKARGKRGMKHAYLICNVELGVSMHIHGRENIYGLLTEEIVKNKYGCSSIHWTNEGSGDEWVVYSNDKITVLEVVDETPPTSERNWVGMEIKYVSQGGSTVEIPAAIDPYKILGLPVAATHQEVKTKFRSMITCEDRTQRVKVSLSYAIICNVIFKQKCPYFYGVPGTTTFEFDITDPVVKVLTGDCDSLWHLAMYDPSCLEETEPAGYSLLYIAARSGFMNVVSYLIHKGADVNRLECVGTTTTSALHAAAFYGHYPVVNTLMSRGASMTLRNSFGSTPVDEALTAPIRSLLQESLSDPLLLFVRLVQSQRYMAKLETVEVDKKIVVWRIQRNVGRRALYTETGLWERAWHGTKQKNVLSILKNGLLIPGSVVDGVEIKRPDGHYDDDVELDGIKGFAKAIFVSPEVAYACHPCYAGRISSPEKGDFYILLEVAVRSGSFTRHDSTVYRYMKGDRGVKPEMRVTLQPGQEEAPTRIERDIMLRVNEAANVVVLAATLISTAFLERSKLSQAELGKLIAGEDGKKM